MRLFRYNLVNIKRKYFRITGVALIYGAAAGFQHNVAARFTGRQRVIDFR